MYKEVTHEIAWIWDWSHLRLHEDFVATLKKFSKESHGSSRQEWQEKPNKQSDLTSNVICFYTVSNLGILRGSEEGKPSWSVRKEDDTFSHTAK